MKTFLLSLFLFLSLFSISQKENLIKQSLLKNINEYRTSKNLGVFENVPIADTIAIGVYNIFGTVEPIMLMNELGFDKDWSIYHVEGHIFNVTKKANNIDDIDKSIKRYISDTTKIKNCEWYYKSNIGNDKPYLFGIYVVKINDGGYYETYRLMFITLKNIPMEYKCSRPVEN